MKRETTFKILIVLFVFSILGNLMLAYSYYKKQNLNFEIYKNSDAITNLPRFDQYLTEEKDEAFSGNFVNAVDYSSNKELNSLLNEWDKTNIDFWFKKGPNFADHYVAMQLGCGTMCHYLIIADAVNGKLYKPETWAGLNFDFDINSKLLIADDPWSISVYKNTFDNDPNKDILKTSYSVWEDNSLKLIENDKIDVTIKINK